MKQALRPNIYNIASNYHFFESFLQWLEEGFAGKISEAKIFLPNRRAVREFQNAFAARFGKALAIPKVKAIADISHQDFLDSFPREQVSAILDELFKIKVLDGFDYLFFLSNEIVKTKVFGENISFAQAIAIATQLKNLFDDIERQEISLDALYSVDDSELASHRQFTLEFLQKFYLRVKNSVLKNNIFSSVAYQNFIIGKLAETVVAQGLKSPLIIAGSTGSVNYSKKLIEAVVGDKNGFVVLYGLNLLGEVSDERHPQFILNELIKSLGSKVSSDDLVEKFTENSVKNIANQKDISSNSGAKNISFVQEISYEKFRICDKSRLDFLSYLMLPSLETYKWQVLSQKINLPKIAKDLQKSFFYLETNNEIAEARMLAAVAQDAVLKNEKIAIIVSDNNFVDILKAELQKLSLEFNDARSLDLSSSKLVNLILLLLELVENNFESATLLAILKHQYSPYCDDKNLAQFEIDILREQRNGKGLKAITKKINLLQNNENAKLLNDGKLQQGKVLQSQNIALKAQELPSEELQNFFNNFLEDVAPLTSLAAVEDLAFYFTTIISVVEKFTKISLEELMSKEAAAEELARLFDKLKLQNGYSINSKDAPKFFQHLFAQIGYFEKSDAVALVQIMSPIEARLLNFDVVAVSSLNQGDFPQIEGENWLGRKIRSEIGIDLSAKKYGQNAYDFCNYLSNKKIILTRCQTKVGALTIASPFILRLEILCKKFAIKLNDGSQYFARLKSLENSENNILQPSQSVDLQAAKPIDEALENSQNLLDKKFKLQILSPKPPLKYRPQKISITEIAKLFSNPYEIYAKKILQLKELNKIDYQPEYREFGTFVHKALEEFVKNREELEIFLKKAEKIFAEFFISDEAKLIWWPKFVNIFKNFVEEDKALQACYDYLEVPVKLAINNILISGKIDRVSCDENGVAKIFDYKTGVIPAVKDVASGLQPQLSIYALMLCLGVIENKNLQNLTPEKIDSLNYWKLATTSEGEIKAIIKTPEDVAAVVAAAKIGLENLLKYFSEEKNGYFLKENLEPESEYWHISRADVILANRR